MIDQDMVPGKIPETLKIIPGLILTTGGLNQETDGENQSLNLDIALYLVLKDLILM